ncbi:MAG: nitrilase family protein [Flavobacteriales bacterium]|nr:nitrilase family protein [Flavobacteriales bacterium]
MNLKITIIQSELHWEKKAKNLALFTEKIASITEATDVIMLPEMFTTGFTMNAKPLAETMNGEAIKWMKQQAKNKNAAIVGSLIITEKKLYFNRLIWVQPDGKVYHYDKRHLFRMANEHETFSAGNSRLIVAWRGWKICPLVCYDLRFPVWSRNKEFKVQSLKFKVDLQSDNKARILEHETLNPKPVFDLLIYVANWPEARKEPWCKLLEARAIENQVYVVGVNRVGLDGKEISYSGNSAVIDPKGNAISNIATHQNHIQTIELNRQELEDFREKFPVGLDGDDFEIK